MADLPPISAGWRARCPWCHAEGTGGFRTTGDVEHAQEMAERNAVHWHEMHLKNGCPDEPKPFRPLPLVATKVIDTRLETTRA